MCCTKIYLANGLLCMQKHCQLDRKKCCLSLVRLSSDAHIGPFVRDVRLRSDHDDEDLEPCRGRNNDTFTALH
jgi:hypothetical protein